MRKKQEKQRPEPAYIPERVYIDERCRDHPTAQRILSRLEHVPRTVIRNASEKRAILEKVLEAKDPLREGKRSLWLTRQKGRFIKPCPCTPRYLGCNYFIINLILQCPLDCTYCILQNYLAEPWISVQVNTEDLWTELDRFLEKFRTRYLRLGTGELGDSLALDHLTDFSRDFIAYFRKWPNIDFEFKTKTTNIQNLLGLDPPQNIVVSWSLNTERMAREEERNAPLIEARLEAARILARRGFRVGFHFDPLLRHLGWKNGYAEVVRSLFGAVPAARIAWISLGSFRFPPPLKKVIQTRFPESKIIYEEFIAGQDGKSRYFRPLRLELFRQVVGLIRKNGGERVPLYLCMENTQMWRDAMGWEPKGKRAVEETLSPRWES